VPKIQSEFRSRAPRPRTGHNSARPKAQSERRIISRRDLTFNFLRRDRMRADPKQPVADRCHFGGISAGIILRDTRAGVTRALESVGGFHARYRVIAGKRCAFYNANRTAVTPDAERTIYRRIYRTLVREGSLDRVCVLFCLAFCFI